MTGMRAVFVALLAGGLALAQGPGYFWAELALPEGAVAALPERAQTLSIPSATWSEGTLLVTGAADEAELLQSCAYVYLDAPFFLAAVEEAGWTMILRGTEESAELIVFGTGEILDLSGFDILEALGLIPQGKPIELSGKEVPLKLPRPPEGMRLDPILWTLVGHPDWFSFARDYGLERTGLRVRVVAELNAPLGEAFEGCILSSTDSLAELLIPIPLLPTLGQDPGVKLVRPPYRPEPLGGQ